MAPDNRALAERAAAWAQKLGVRPREICVAPLRGKWGQYSAGVVTLAEDLVERDQRLQDVVAVHELLHARGVRDHGRVFRALMTAIVPGWQQVLDAAR